MILEGHVTNQVLTKKALSQLIEVGASAGVLADCDPSICQFLFGDVIQEARQEFWWVIKEGWPWWEG